MSDSIKVGDQFKLPVRIGDRGAVIQDDGERIDYSKLDLMVSCIAINNHDQLQQENAELREALFDLVGCNGILTSDKECVIRAKYLLNK